MGNQLTDRWYGFLEGYYNERKVFLLPGISSLVYGTGRYYLAGFSSYQIHPLVVLSAYGLANLDDRSFMVGPMVQCTLLQNWELSGGIYAFGGSSRTELGRFRPFYFGMLQFYF